MKTIDELLVEYFDTPTGRGAGWVDIADIRSLISRSKKDGAVKGFQLSAEG